jgi:uncharacterized protein
MSYARYKHLTTNDYVFVENQQGLLYLSDGTQFTIPAPVDPQLLAEYKIRTRSTIKSKKVRAIRILLGHGCNFSCGYCMQKDIGNPFERPRNDNNERFVQQLADLDRSNLVRVELWGGETFLYWNDIVPIIEALDTPNIEFYFSTNGSPLSLKHIEYFKNMKGKVSIGFSHDGPVQEEQRGPDYIDKKIPVLKAIMEARDKVGLSFNTVITKQSYDLFAINDFFKEVRDRSGVEVNCVMQMAQIYDAADLNNEWAITGDDLIKFKNILQRYLTACKDQYLSHGDIKDGAIVRNSLFHFLEGGVLGIVNEFGKEEIRAHSTNCGSSSEDILSVDINGDVRMCPHSGDEYIYGNLDNLAGVVVKDLDLDRSETHCKDCTIYRLCKSTCPIDIPYPVFLKNCDVEKIFFTEKQRCALEILLNGPVELEDWGLETMQTKW